MVSIVLPTYNGARYLRQAVDSCLEQSYKCLELIVVVDGSNDETLDVLDTYHDVRLQIIVNSKNAGLPESLNIGFAVSSGDYLTWTSDDNWYEPQALATMADHLDAHPDVAFVYAPFWEVDESGCVRRLNLCGEPETILDSNPVGACFLYRRQVYDVIGDYDPQSRWSEDYQYWLRVSQNHVMRRLLVPLYNYRFHGRSLTSQAQVYFGRQRLIVQMKRQHFGLNWRDYMRQMAYVDIEEAFASYQNRSFSRVPLLVICGVSRNPSWLRNLGVASIFVRSMKRVLARSD